jgi:hypothetical protein
MGQFQSLSVAALGLMAVAGINAGESMAMPRPEPLLALETGDGTLSHSTVVDLNELTANPNIYDFFTFRPNLEKLILSGEAETEHISILWYTIPDGSVGLHYHAMTESVYTIEGTQTDAKGVYPTGSIYFNPPGSGHEVSDSTGFFLLAYASPPDFANTALIEEYTPIHINTADPNLETVYPFVESQAGVAVYAVPLDADGGITSEFIKTTSASAYEYTGNYLLVLEGSCAIEGTVFGEKMLIVATTIQPQSYQVSAVEGGSCLALGLSF